MQFNYVLTVSAMLLVTTSLSGFNVMTGSEQCHNQGATLTYLSNVVITGLASLSNHIILEAMHEGWLKCQNIKIKANNYYWLLTCAYSYCKF